MIVWSGFGILVPLIWAGIFGILSNFDFDSENSQAVTAMFISSPIVWLVGRFLNRPRMIVHETNNQPEIIYPDHTFFWIKMQYWGGLLIVLGLIFLIF